MLKGVKVLAVEQYGAGPFGTQFLADMGAEVIKIENPAEGGDVARSVGPHWHKELPETAQSVFFQGLNRAKKSLTLNLNKAEGRAVFHKLVQDADAVTSNLRGDVPAKLGLTYAQLSEINPRIVCGHLTGYGREGERAKWPGYDFLMQAETGYFELTGEPGSAPARCGLSLIDLMTGSVMSMAVVAGIMQARSSGQGRDIDVSLFDLSLYNLNYIGHWYLNGGEVIGRLARSAHASLTPCQTYKTRDGWIYLMCNKEKFWGTLCQKIGRPEWIADPRFVTFKERFTNRPLITEILDEALSAHTTDEWMKIFAGAVPAAPIYDVQEALENPWVKDSDRIAHIPVEGGKDLQMLASPIRYAGRPETSRAPAMGEHTEAVLADAGYTPAQITQLRALGAVWKMPVTPLPRGSTPQYTLLAQELLRGIGAGDYPLGSLLPTEAELCKRYAVSRITARAAVRELQTRGLVSRHPGIGTRIESVQTRTEFVHVSESVDAILQSAQATRFKVLKQGEVVADAALAAELHCAEGQSFLVAEGLRTRESAPPQCHARLYFPKIYSRVIEHLDGHPGSVMLLLERLFGVRLEEMRQTISAANLRAAEARVLQAKPREAALQTRRWHLGENGRLHMMGISLYPQDRYSYALRMRRQNNASTEDK